ncbi:site-specific integrase [Chelativorans sp. AA-79]|uniref:tyrosine-type recombinase/integrase n=1 Tax=Chelativorans sp. AA-79 TaxID=3028735 RepID=UPI0023F94424|nr:site-specific integrase [Chelativorans sp. AA-79]WEX08255.1 site-specific integrase [Chelativorans sp. AA-79]
MIDKYGNRKYLTSMERRRFLQHSMEEDLPVQLFCRTLLETGCRISEALNLTFRNIDLEEDIVVIRSLKKREKIRYRIVPISSGTATLFVTAKESTPESQYDDPIWSWSRMTGYRYICSVMSAAGIKGQQASPKGLRHGFAVAALEAGVPMNLVQRWLGHAHWSTTAIYADVVGPEERGFAERLWQATGAPSTAMTRAQAVGGQPATQAVLMTRDRVQTGRPADATPPFRTGVLVG